VLKCLGGDIMSEKNEIVQKPNQTIMITNKNITSLQRKSYNVILHEARKELKLNENQTSFIFSISELKNKSGIRATDNRKFKKSIEALASIQIRTVHENGDWGVFNLISYAGKEGDFLEVELPKPIRNSLIANNYYTTLDLMIIKNLEGKYAIILYELAMRYSKKQIPELTIGEFRELTGTIEIKSYDNFNNNKKKVIEPAIKEINEKTDIILSYDVKKIGRSVRNIKFKINKKKEEKEIQIGQLDFNNNNIHFENGKIEENQDYLILYSLLPENEQIESRKNELKKLLENHSFQYLESDIKYCKRMEIKKGFWGYFLSSVKKGHYSADEIRKKELKKEKEQKKNIEEEKEEELKKEKVKEILNNPSEEILNKFEIDYKKMTQFVKGEKIELFKSWLNRYVEELD